MTPSDANPPVSQDAETAAPRAPQGNKQPYALVALVTIQSFCTLFFIYDIIVDFGATGWSFQDELHLYVEATAALAIAAAIVFEVRYLLWLLRRKAHLEHSVSVAKAAVHDVIEAQFQAWGLTPSEQDIANFVVKGMGIADIAALRGTAEGTVKSHLNAIYRKAGVTGRGELLSDILDALT